METPNSFEDALAGARFGNASCLAWLWRRHQPALLGWLSGHDPQRAEDITSEAWIETTRALNNFEGDEKGFRSWLFTIARRRLIDFQRREFRREQLSGNALRSIINDPNPETDTLESLASTAAIALIKETLSAEQAEVVLLRVIAGMDVDQVATIMDKKPGTVRVLQHRGLRKLAQVLSTESRPTSVTENSGV